jgi:hypothetical protein
MDWRSIEMETSRSSLADGFNKDVEIQSVPSTDLSALHEVGCESKPQLMAEKGDIEACPVAISQSQDVEFNGNGPVTRISTKSSERDPGPPPDGGWTAWTQGTYSPSVVFGL